MRGFAAASCIVLGALLAAAPATAGIGVRVSGGLSHISYGDFNDFADYFNNEVLAAGGASGEIASIHWVPEFEGEVVVSLAPMIDIGIGAGIITGGSDFSFKTGADRLDYSHTVKAYPLTGTVYVKLPFLPFAKPYAFAGGGMYHTKATFDESVTTGGSTDGFTADLTKWGFGLHGGAGLSFALAPRIGLDVGVKGRWIKIKGLTGTAKGSDGKSVDVFLAYYTDKDGALQFGPEALSDKGTYGEGAVDLSGYAFTLTMTVAF
jgi:opacity protein-like surface antigen